MRRRGLLTLGLVSAAVLAVGGGARHAAPGRGHALLAMAQLQFAAGHRVTLA